MYCPEWMKDIPEPCPNCQYRHRNTNEGTLTKPPRMGGLKENEGLVTIAGEDMEKQRGNKSALVEMQKQGNGFSGLVDGSRVTADHSRKYLLQCNPLTLGPIPATPHIDLERNSVVDVGEQKGDSISDSFIQKYPQAGGLSLANVVFPEAQRRCQFKPSPPRADGMATFFESPLLLASEADNIDPILSELMKGESNAARIAVKKHFDNKTPVERLTTLCIWHDALERRKVSAGT